MTATDLAPQYGTADALFARKRMWAFAVPIMVLAYLAYVVFAFDLPATFRNANADNARALLADTYSHKVHITRDNRSGAVTFAIEGEKKGRYPAGTHPDWVTPGDATRVDLGDGHLVTFGPQTITYDVPGYGQIAATPGPSGITQSFPPGVRPDWINASKNRVAITTPAGRLTVTRNRAEVFRYFTGWELFFFTLNSPFHGLGPGALISRAADGQTGAIWHDFWNNPMWLHKDVFGALFETVLMAFLGTFGAAIVALPLSVMAARNFTRILALRFAMRRLFDFIRGVDGLIWTIILTRAFGLGPLTGALAILLTDTGTFGKMFSEALENVDEKQIDGLRSTGARPIQRFRFAVIPQITPVLLSQVLYYLESNTRSATIIGAITGGGIGLLLTQAIITQKDWEEVTYYIILVVLMVMVMDAISGWLRRRLIKGAPAGQ